MSLESKYSSLHNSIQEKGYLQGFGLKSCSRILKSSLHKFGCNYKDLPEISLKNEEGLTTAGGGMSLPFNWEKELELDPFMQMQRERDRLIWQDIGHYPLFGPGRNEGWIRFAKQYLHNYLFNAFSGEDEGVLDDFKNEFNQILEEYIFIQSKVFGVLRESGDMETYQALHYEDPQKLYLYCHAELEIKDDVRTFIQSVIPYMNFVFPDREMKITEDDILGRSM